MKWPWSRPTRDVPAYVDTPAGILSAGGVHYRTSRALLDDYAGDVLAKTDLGTLLQWAEAWQRSPAGLAGLVLVGLLVVASWPVAVVAAVLVYAAWAVASPGMAAPRGAKALGWIGHPVLQGLLYIGALSALAAADRTAATWVGIAGFVALRLGLVQLALSPILAPVLARLYPLPVPDQALRSVILHEAVRQGIRLEGMREIEDRVRSFWKR